MQDNLGVRLLMLERRLAERDFGLRIERDQAKEIEADKDKPKDAAGRAALIAGKIEQAKSLLAMTNLARKRDGRNILRDIRDLYAGEADRVGELAEAAKKLLVDNPP